jgi:hypothetical protein
MYIVEALHGSSATKMWNRLLLVAFAHIVDVLTDETAAEGHSSFLVK